MVNDYILDRASKMRHTRFSEVLQLVTKTSKHCIIIKRDLKDVFQNISMAL